MHYAQFAPATVPHPPDPLPQAKPQGKGGTRCTFGRLRLGSHHLEKKHSVFFQTQAAEVQVKSGFRACPHIASHREASALDISYLSRCSPLTCPQHEDYRTYAVSGLLFKLLPCKRVEPIENYILLIYRYDKWRRT